MKPSSHDHDASTEGESIRSQAAGRESGGANHVAGPRKIEVSGGEKREGDEAETYAMGHRRNCSKGWRGRIGKQIFERDDNLCQYCGVERRRLILEHVVPECRKGPTEPFNLVAACMTCNKLKGKFVWLPLNFELVVAGNPEWRAHVIKLAEADLIAQKAMYPKWIVRTGKVARHFTDERAANEYAIGLIATGVGSLTFRKYIKPNQIAP